MHTNCLNPSCGTPFRYLYEGRIFAAERVVTSPDGQKTDKTIDHYWLCDTCGKSMTVVIKNGIATAVPLFLDFMTQSQATARPVLVG